MKNTLLWFCAFAAVLGSCQSSQEGQATQVADVAGIWWQIDHPHYDPAYLILRQDGTYTFASNPDGEHGASGQYWFEDGKFMISDAFCTVPGEYEVNVKEQKGDPLSLAFSLVEDDCPARVGILTTKEAIWFAPPP